MLCGRSPPLVVDMGCPTSMSARRPSLPLAEGDPAVEQRALTPLVENARRHARSQVHRSLTVGRP